MRKTQKIAKIQGKNLQKIAKIQDKNQSSEVIVGGIKKRLKQLIYNYNKFIIQRAVIFIVITE